MVNAELVAAAEADGAPVGVIKALRSVISIPTKLGRPYLVLGSGAWARR
jgi:hypothetical protein